MAAFPLGAVALRTLTCSSLLSYISIVEYNEQVGGVSPQNKTT